MPGPAETIPADTMNATRTNGEPRKPQSVPAGAFAPATGNGAVRGSATPSMAMGLTIESPRPLEACEGVHETMFRMNGSRLMVVASSALSVENAKSFQSDVLGEIKDSVRAIDLDLSGVLRFDTWALCTLLSLRKYFSAREIHLRLIDPSPRVETVLEMTKTRKLFEVVQAVAEFPESNADRDTQRRRVESMG